MPKLRRMRLVSIGHESARFEDVLLDFTDRSDRPANSVVWLRNGGGKTSLLSLFFAGVRPNQRDFLGKRSEEGVRQLDQYVGSRDAGIVVCEWELDAEQTTLFDNAPRYLSGVFYERSTAQDGDGASRARPLYFAAMVSPNVDALTLDGLPLETGDEGQRRRRNLNGFRRTLRQLDDEHPDLNVFVSDRQNRFIDELASRGIDSEVFYYQVMMNDREGGVSQRLSFASDDEFVAFLLEMAFSQRRAREVLEQLSTFRQALLTRNEQLKPELEYCSGLQARLQKLVAIHRDRTGVLEQTTHSHRRMLALTSWTIQHGEVLVSESTRLQAEIGTTERDRQQTQKQADDCDRRAAVYEREACRLRFDAVNADYEQAEQEYSAVKRLKEIWSAGRFLARAWENRRQAKEYREQLARRQSEFAPDLERLTQTATEFAGALQYEVSQLSESERNEKQSISALDHQAREALQAAQDAAEQAAGHESEAANLRERLQNADAEFRRLRDSGAVLAEEQSEVEAIERLKLQRAATARDVKHQDELIAAVTVEIESAKRRLEVQRETAATCQLTLSDLQRQLEQAVENRDQLESDPALLRLLGTEHVNIEAAVTKAIEAAGNESAKIRDAILRIQIEAVEDRRAIEWLQGDGDLLPPSRDVEATLDWLGRAGVTAWSGWEYIAGLKPTERRTLIEQFPYLANGVVVANKDYDAVVDMADADDLPHLTAAVALAPAEAFNDAFETCWTVVGPSSDAHFDKDAAARELNRLSIAEGRRNKERSEHESWCSELEALHSRMRDFHSRFPSGWFARQQQKVEVAEAHHQDAVDIVENLNLEIVEREEGLQAARTERDSLQATLGTTERALERVSDFERQHGRHRATWTRALTVAERDGSRCRASQTRHAALAEKHTVEASERRHRMQQVAVSRLAIEAELTRISYINEAAVAQVAGHVDVLRHNYQMLVDEYERKMNEDGLNGLAEKMDREAEKEESEYRRVMQGLRDISDADVEHELKLLPSDTSAERRAEEIDKATHEAIQRRGNLGNQRRPRKEAIDAATRRCNELLKSGPLPEVQFFDDADRNGQEAATHQADAEQHRHSVRELESGLQQLRTQLTETDHCLEMLERDKQQLITLQTSYEAEFARIPVRAPGAESEAEVSMEQIDAPEQLAAMLISLQTELQTQRAQHLKLDERRNKTANEIGGWSRQSRFEKLSNSVASRFAAMRPESLESKADFFSGEITDRVVEIERNLDEANQHHERVVNIVLAAVDEGLSLLNRVSRMSRLPESLPQAGKRFLVIETNASENPSERRTRVGELIDELLESGRIDDGLTLIQKAVQRVARMTKVRILHPDLHHATKRISISAMRLLSDGERLTCAVALFCALVRLRQHDGNRRGSSVLVLDNPIGKASRVSFLDLQREVAQSMNVQLIYATGVKDLSAIGALENIIRLRNSRVDRRTGRRVVEVENGDALGGDLQAARIVFDSPPGSAVSSSDSVNEVMGDVDPA